MLETGRWLSSPDDHPRHDRLSKCDPRLFKAESSVGSGFFVAGAGTNVAVARAQWLHAHALSDIMAVANCTPPKRIERT